MVPNGRGREKPLRGAGGEKGSRREKFRWETESSPDEPSLGRAAGAGGSTAAGAAASSLPPRVPNRPQTCSDLGRQRPLQPHQTLRDTSTTAPQCNEFAGAQWSQKNIYPPQGGAAPRHPRPQVLGPGQAGLEGTWWERHLRREARSIPRADAARRHVQGVGINPLQLPSALSAGCEQIPLKLVHL